MEGGKKIDILGCLKQTFLKFPEPWDHFGLRDVLWPVAGGFGCSFGFAL